MPPRRSPSKPQPPITDDSPSAAVAREIVGSYIDLTPSVDKILASGLSEPGRLHAIELFQRSLGVPGDPMRDPAKAIDAGRAIETN